MKEKGTKKLYNSITNVDSKFIEEAQAKSSKPKIMWVKWGAISACLCAALVSAFAIPKLYPSISENTKQTDAGNESALNVGEPSGYAPGFDSQKTNNTENDTSLYYSNLMLSDGKVNEDALSLPANNMSIDAMFNESILSENDCCLIVEGTVKNVRVKNYTYDIYSDKFEKNGVLHSITNTVVYEVAVDKTWYGEDISGDTIFIEDTAYFTEPIFALKEGGRYVLPIYEYGSSILTPEDEYAGGDITRETVYSTVYPYHPQIEVTKDGSYFVSQNWTTLVANNAKKVIMDTLDYDNFWNDKMYLVDAKTFEEQMSVLISNIKQK